MNIFDHLLADMPDLPAVTSEAALAYGFAGEQLVIQAADALDFRDSDLMNSQNAQEALRVRHQQHHKIMTNMLTINDPGLIVWTTLRQYETGRESGLPGSFLEAESAAWQTAISRCIDHSRYRAQLLAVYGWVAECRNKLLRSVASCEENQFPDLESSEELQQLFLVLLLMGDYRACLNLCNQVVQTVADLKFFNLKIVWPVLYRTGLLWQEERISISDEHLVTNLAKRIITVQHARFADRSITKGKAVVSAAANEYHEVGAQMVADFLSIEGWDVTYLGANVPNWILLETVKHNKPCFLALSVAIAANISKMQHLIDIIREDPEIRHMKIMVGGSAFLATPLAWQLIGADGSAADADSATKLALEWWNDRLGATAE